MSMHIVSCMHVWTPDPLKQIVNHWITGWVAVVLTTKTERGIKAIFRKKASNSSCHACTCVEPLQLASPWRDRWLLIKTMPRTLDGWLWQDNHAVLGTPWMKKSYRFWFPLIALLKLSLFGYMRCFLACGLKTFRFPLSYCSAVIIV